MTADLKIERDYSTWRVLAVTPEGHAFLKALERFGFGHGNQLDNASHLFLLEQAQAAGIDVGS